MAKTFEQWMADNGFSNGYGPGYIYSKQGGSYDRNQAVKAWQAEQGAGTLADMMGGAGPEANPFGGVPTVSTSNRFESGLSDTESRLRALLDNPDSIQQTGAYKFRLKQGEDALQRSMGAKGMLNSGNRLMDLMKYGQDMGSQEYDAQAGRLSNLLGTYGQGYVADKNANTSLFSATEGAKANANRNALGWANLNWDMSKPSATSIRSSGGSTSGLNLGGIGGTWDPEKDPGIARLRQSSIDAYNY